MDLYSQRLITEDDHLIAERRVLPKERGTDRWVATNRDRHGRRLLIQERYLTTDNWMTIGTVAAIRN
ncbi:hypothetical protein [Solicola gregarius]|uniref:Uncharacterized protein n=1 Tax=Solicola gregarius TaxID=2908642 RepID=A0AA46YKD2_9ACTN|nr:hypothetical protein [Solicola gregarius]UYM05640.1 hypothetical protein L0C25_00710 [Solicola gregarius]